MTLCLLAPIVQQAQACSPFCHTVASNEKRQQPTETLRKQGNRQNAGSKSQMLEVTNVSKLVFTSSIHSARVCASVSFLCS